jgi:hypothetical protein
MSFSLHMAEAKARPPCCGTHGNGLVGRAPMLETDVCEGVQAAGVFEHVLAGVGQWTRAFYTRPVLV